VTINDVSDGSIYNQRSHQRFRYRSFPVEQNGIPDGLLRLPTRQISLPITTVTPGAYSVEGSSESESAIVLAIAELFAHVHPSITLRTGNAVRYQTGEVSVCQVQGVRRWFWACISGLYLVRAVVEDKCPLHRSSVSTKQVDINKNRKFLNFSGWQNSGNFTFSTEIPFSDSDSSEDCKIQRRLASTIQKLLTPTNCCFKGFRCLCFSPSYYSHCFPLSISTARSIRKAKRTWLSRQRKVIHMLPGTSSFSKLLSFWIISIGSYSRWTETETAQGNAIPQEVAFSSKIDTQMGTLPPFQSIDGKDTVATDWFAQKRQEFKLSVEGIEKCIRRRNLSISTILRFQLGDIVVT